MEMIIMYECCSAKRFLRLVMLDMIIFSIIFVLFFIGKAIVYSAAGRDNDEDKIFLPVIMYHSIRSGTPQEYAVTPEQVEADLAYLKSSGFTSVSAQELVDYVYNGGSLPENPVLITLDDSFYNNLCYLVPLLEKYDMNAVVSVVGSYTDNNAAADPHVPEYSYLTWEDINELLASGRIEIGSHTYNMHSDTFARRGCGINDGETNEEYAEILNEDISLLQSEMCLYTGSVPFVFAYPYGIVSRESLPVLRGNGFLITLTCREIPNYITRDADCLFGLGRYNRSGLYSTEEYMQKLLEGR